MKERILLVGRKSDLVENIHSALQGLGHECLFFEHGNTFTQKSRIVRKLLRIFPELRSLKRWENDGVNKKLLTSARQIRPTLLFVINGWNIYPKTVKEIKSCGIPTVNWFSDLMTHWPVISHIAPAYDYFFTPDEKVLEALKAIGVVAHLAPLSSSAVSVTFPDNPRQYPISFVGSYHPVTWRKREEFLASIRDLGVHIWGPPTWKTSLLKKHYRGKAQGREMLEIYRQSKIVIDIPWDHIDASATSVRPFEATAAGACLFYYDIRPGMTKLYDKNREYVPFKTTQELREKLVFYLSRPELLESIARAGYGRFMRDHTYQVRLQEILDKARN